MYLYFWAIVVVFVFLRWLTGQELDDWVHQRPNPLIFHLYLYIWAFVFVFLRGKELDDGHRHSPRPGGWWASHFPFVFVFVWVRASILSFSICICISEHLYLYGPEDKNLMIETVTAPGRGDGWASHLPFAFLSTFFSMGNPLINSKATARNWNIIA